MKNIFSANEETPEVHPAFREQPQRGEQSQAPTSCNPTLGRSIQPNPNFEELAHRSAPGSAVSADLTYTWRR